MSANIPNNFKINKSTNSNSKLVKTRIIFLKIGEIDSRNEKYNAEVFIESYWEDDQIFKSILDSRSNIRRKSLSLIKSTLLN